MAESHGEAKGQKTGAHTEADGGHGGAFPPFDSSTFASQLVSLVIAFVALYLIVSRIALPRVGSVIDAVLPMNLHRVGRGGPVIKSKPIALIAHIKISVGHLMNENWTRLQPLHSGICLQRTFEPVPDRKWKVSNGSTHSQQIK